MKFKIHENLFFIKDKGYVITNDEHPINNTIVTDGRIINVFTTRWQEKDWKTIIGSTFPIQDIPLLDIDGYFRILAYNLAYKLSTSFFIPYQDRPDNKVDLHCGLRREGFVEGYISAKAEGTFTKDDLEKAYDSGRYSVINQDIDQTFYSFINSLRKIKSIDIDENQIEIECPDNIPDCEVYHTKIKFTVINVEYE